MSVGQVEETRVLTRVLLAEHAEQLAFATSLRTRHNDHQHLIDAAIRYVLQKYMYLYILIHIILGHRLSWLRSENRSSLGVHASWHCE